MRIVFYHDKCQDGFASAYVARKYLGDTAQYVAVDYNVQFSQKYPLSNAEIIFVDFCPSWEDYVFLKARKNNILVLDHHEGRFAQFQGKPGCILDKDKCGAVLVHEHFFPDSPLPEYLRYIQENDLYRFEGETGRLFSAGLYSVPYSFEEWDKVLDKPDVVARMVERGEVVQITYRQQAQFLAEVAQKATLGGHTIWCVNYAGPVPAINMIGEVVGKLRDAPVLIWSSQSLTQARLSFRSNGIPVCIELARIFGGGGHPTSSGAYSTFADFTRHVQFIA